MKARYTQKLLRWLLAEKEKPANKAVDVNKLKPSFRDTIRWVARIRADFPPSIVHNCWRKSGLLPLQPAQVAIRGTGRELQAFIENAGMGEDELGAEEYINLVGKEEGPEVREIGEVVEEAMSLEALDTRDEERALMWRRRTRQDNHPSPCVRPQTLERS